MEGGYEARIPGLIDLMSHGSPYHRLLAAAMLVSWGQPAGFEALTTWASHPDQAPWAAEPVTVDRITGADSAYELLADALRSSFWSGAAPNIKPLQQRAARALIALAPSQYMGGTLMVALARDRSLEEAVTDDVRAALEAGLNTLDARRAVGFDLPFQLASLLGSLAPYDDDAAAGYASRLVAVDPNNQRMLKTLIDSLARGRGKATIARLDRLKTLKPDLADEVERAKARRA